MAEKIKKPEIEGFMTEGDVQNKICGFSPLDKKTKKEELHLEQHFNAGSIKLGEYIVQTLEELVKYAVNKIAKDYTVEVLEKQYDKSPYSDELYGCIIIKIKETGDQYYVGQHSLRYIGNGHKEISEPSKQFLSEIVKRPRKLLELDKSRIPEFADSILEKILEKEYVGECKTSEIDFLADLVDFAKDAFANGAMGLSATDEKYVPGRDYENEKSEILKFKKEDKRFTNIFEILKDRFDENPEKAEEKLAEFRGKAHADQIITSLAEKKYNVALSFAKKMEPEYYVLIESVCRELSCSYHSKTHSHSEIK